MAVKERSQQSATARTCMVVARFVDGRTLKGTTHDFSPGKPMFRVHDDDKDEDAPPVQVSLEELKAVFFVKSFEGRRTRKDAYDLDGPAYGRKIAVKFGDGEIIAGHTAGYKPDAPGFFMFPADPEGNNSRIFVINKFVSQIRWL